MFSRTGSHKLVLLGDTFVGKSSFVIRFVRDKFNDAMESTVGAAFMTQSVFCNGKTVKFEIWDTAGQERYRSLTPMYYRGAKVALVIYDITNYESFQCAKSWIEELSNRATSVEIVALVGNKIDLEDERSVSTEEAREYARLQNMMFFEVSVKENINIKEIFLKIADKLPASKESPLEDTTDSTLTSSTPMNTINNSVRFGKRQGINEISGSPADQSKSCCILI